MQQNEDFLAALEREENGIHTHKEDNIFQVFEKNNESEIEKNKNIWEKIFFSEEEVPENPILFHLESSETEKENIKTKSFFQRFIGSLVFLIKYICTSAGIFLALLVISNYSAYWNLAQSILFAEELKQTKQSLIESVAAAEIKQEAKRSDENIDTFRSLREDEIEETKKSIHDISAYKNTTKQNIDLWIEITPYENRVVIPKIGKNIPLIDIKQKTVSGASELNDIFMKELENGVIRYPGSARPWENGNTFIFGHSSNFPWLEWDYNDVFALLDKVVFDDEIIVYYGQEKYTYKIRTKNVIRPGDVSVLKSDSDDSRAQITLMTCWPIGTTLNRLVLTGELVSVE